MAMITMRSPILVFLTLVTCVLAQGEETSGVDTYEQTFAKLAECALPSAKLFARSQDPQTGWSKPDSPFDLFCKGNKESVPQFMCQYYVFLFTKYYSGICEKRRVEFETLPHWAMFRDDPQQPCQYLTDNLQSQINETTVQSVFSTNAVCQAVCPPGNQFCLGFAFLLKIYQTELKQNPDPEQTQQTAAAVAGDQTKVEGSPAENGNVSESKENLSENPDKTLLGLEPDLVPPEQKELEIIGGGEDPIDGSGDGQEGGTLTVEPLENQETNDTTAGDGLNYSDTSYSSEGSVMDDEENGFPQPGAPGNPHELPQPPKVDDQHLPVPVQHEEQLHEQHAAIQEPDRNLERERELALLEEESSSHFLAYTLSAIILIMVTYILYHNKQKIVAIIVEGKNPGGRRRRYNQNVVYTTLDEEAA